MAAAKAIGVRDALDELVNQFADPMSFLRELIQNSLDAGSTEVEVRVEFDPDNEGADPQDDAAPGVARVHVDDFGDGMDSSIIDTKLTRLFSSAKDGDQTKIGKFGIGFVSVFAIRPDAVCVDTGRSGEFWRVLFSADTSFKKIRLADPVEGTQITVFKAMSRGEARELATRAGDVVRYWCKHVDGDVRFEGELVNQDFDVPGQLKIDHDDGFARVVVGHAVGEVGSLGFYNRGLTLVEGSPAGHEREWELRGLHLKLSSPHLEHTLTRDNVIRDRQYDRAMDVLMATIRGPLCDEVFRRLETLVKATEVHATGAGNTEMDMLHLAALWHWSRDHVRRGPVRRRGVARTPSGRLLSLDELESLARRAREGLVVAGVRTHLTDALEADGSVPIHAPHGTSLLVLLQRLAKERVRGVWQTTAHPLPPRDDLETAGFEPLRRAVERLLRSYGSRVAGVHVGHFAYPESGILPHVAIAQIKPFTATDMGEVGELPKALLSWRRHLVLNADHPTVAALVALAQHESALAALGLVKLFFLTRQLDAEVDAKLASITVEHRSAFDLRRRSS